MNDMSDRSEDSIPTLISRDTPARRPETNMTPERWRQIDELAQAVVSHAPIEREALLAAACAGDEALLRDVHAQLKFVEQANSFLEAPAIHDAAQLFEPHEAALKPGSIISHYKIEKKIGAGGMGEVYLAHDAKLDKRVALKVLPEKLAAHTDRLQRFTREAKAAAALNHPNIITVHEIDAANSLHFIVTEYIDGITLREKAKSEWLRLKESLDIARQVADALAAAHDAGIVHRDIKPENIMIRRDGYVKVLDFGLAKLTESKAKLFDPEAPTRGPLKTSQGMIMGTVEYMSPEQARGLDVDYRTDIWSLGVVLYEMISGDKPFGGKTPMDVLFSVAEREPKPVDIAALNIPSSVESIVRKMLAKDRDERYQSASEVSNELRRVLRDIEFDLVNQATDREHAKSEGDTILKTATDGSIGARKTVSPTWSGQYLLNQVKTHKPAAIALTLILAAAISLFIFLPHKANLATTQAYSLVALPTQVYGADDVKYFSEAIPNTLSTMLGQVQGLETKAPPSSLEFEKIHGDLKLIADTYKVNTFVETSVTADADRLILNVQLVEAPTRRVIWSKSYEGQRRNYLDLVKQAADGVRAIVKPNSEPLIATSMPGTSEPELAFQKGKYYSNLYNNLAEIKDFDAALTAFKNALELDPNLADAAAEIGLLYVFRIEKDSSASDMVPQVVIWAQKALQIKPDCFRAVVALAAAEEQSPNASNRKLLQYGLRAVRLGPRDSQAALTLSHTLLHTSAELAGIAAAKSESLDPLYAYPPENLANQLHVMGRTAEAIAPLDRMLAIEPEAMQGTQMKILMLAELGQVTEASRLLNQPKQQSAVADGQMPLQYFLEVQYAVAAQSGDAKKADSSLNQLMKIAKDPKTTTAALLDLVTDVLPLMVRHGKKDEALTILVRCAKGGLPPPYDMLMLNPNLAPLRDDPRFKEVSGQSKLQFDEMIQILNDAKAKGELPPYLEAPMADLLKQLGG